MEYLSHIEWPHVATELLEFAGAYLAVGAVGYRYAAFAAARRRHSGDVVVSTLLERTLRSAAALGLVGALVGLWHVLDVLPGAAERQHVTAAHLVTHWTSLGAWLWLTVLAIVGFGAALAGRRWGWPLAAVGILAGTLREAMFGQWGRLLKPGHLVAGGLWLGTLFVLVAVGLTTVLRSAEARSSRGAIVASLVHGFSPLALLAAGSLVLLGWSLAWRELPAVSALWTTPYGATLAGKLSLVAVVFALGAWNWRRQKPRLGTDASAASLRQSATGELAVAGLVLFVTAVLAGMPPAKP